MCKNKHKRSIATTAISIVVI